MTNRIRLHMETHEPGKISLPRLRATVLHDVVDWSVRRRVYPRFWFRQQEAIVQQLRTGCGASARLSEVLL